MWGPLQEATCTTGELRQCVHSRSQWCAHQRCAVLQLARERKSLRKPGLGKEQGQLSEDSEVPRREETFLRCTFPVAEWLLQGVWLVVFAHTPTAHWALQKGRGGEFPTPPRVSADLFRCFVTWWCFLFTYTPGLWGFPSLWFAKRIRKTQFCDQSITDGCY